MSQKVHDIIIVQGGPSSLTTEIHAKIIGLETLILEHPGILDGVLDRPCGVTPIFPWLVEPQVEIENISSFKDGERVLSFEIMRKKEPLDKRLTVVQGNLKAVHFLVGKLMKATPKLANQTLSEKLQLVNVECK